jgi:hypothetical protein
MRLATASSDVKQVMDGMFGSRRMHGCC